MGDTTITISFIGVVVAMFVSLLVYFRQARQWGLLANPESRSSHTKPVIKAAGFIIPLGVIIFTLLLGYLNIYILTGLIALSAVSFVDDMMGLSVIFRLGVQCLAAALLLYWLWTVSDISLLFIILAFPWCIGHLNACNFMDGINGMLILNMIGLFILYALSGIIGEEVIIYTIGLIVTLLVILGVFNVRRQAVCFLGDVGSISLGFLSFLVIVYLITASENLSLVFSMSVFYIDTGMTLLHRLLAGKNILQPHREHLYEILYNEAGVPAVIISLTYLIIQLLVNIYLFYISPLWAHPWWWDGGIVLAVLAPIYYVVKRIHQTPQ